MDILRRIEQLQQRIQQLEADLAELQARRETAQDEAIRKITQQEISQTIDAIDEAREELEREESELPNKRTNGHHPPESQEDIDLPIDPDVSLDREPPSDN